MDILFRFSLLHEHQGAGNVKDAVRIPQQLPGGVEHPVAAEMGGDDLQMGEDIQDMPQAGGMGVVVAGVAHVEQDGNFSLNHFIHGEKPGVINVEPLGIRVHLDTPQAVLQNPLRFFLQTLHFRMDGAEADEAVMGLGLFQNKGVDRAYPVGGIGNRQDHKAADTGLGAALQQHFHGAVHFQTAVQLVKVPDTVAGLACDFIGIYMGMNVDDLHRDNPSFSWSQAQK